MEKILQQSINEFWWKNWVLAYLKDNNKEGGGDISSYILDHILLWKWESLTEEQRQKIRSFNSERIIIRTSEQSDWEWMVDVMPTIVCTIHEVDEILERIREKWYDEWIINYSKNEWTNYNPDNVTISVAPYINQVNFTLTEHPNQKWKILLDLWKEQWYWINKYTETQTLDFLNNALVTEISSFEHFIGDEEKVKSILNLMEKIRELWIFSENRSLQIEWWINFWNLNTNLYQVRDFVENKYADFELGESNYHYWRVFWITPETGIQLPVVKKRFRWNTIIKWEELYPDWYLWFPEIITNKLNIKEQSQNMKWYVPWTSSWSISLAHQNTRPMKEVLNKNKGFAILEDSFDYDIGDLEDWDVVNVKSDWINYEVTKI